MVKNWIKVTNTRRVFRYKNIHKNEYVFAGKLYNRQKWRVLDREFRTKRQAENYAKRWMRRHPYG